MKSFLPLFFFIIIFITHHSCNGQEEDFDQQESDQTDNSSPTLLHRMIRATGGGAGSIAKKGDCRYDKGVWEECDALGVQKRVLKLRPATPGVSPSPPECEAERVQTRPCKKGQSGIIIVA